MIDPTTAAKFDILIAAEHHLHDVRYMNADKPNARIVRVAQRAYDAAKANLSADEIALLESISGQAIA